VKYVAYSPSFPALFSLNRLPSRMYRRTIGLNAGPVTDRPHDFCYGSLESRITFGPSANYSQRPRDKHAAITSA
jgi:hypothetical protein